MRRKASFTIQVQKTHSLESPKFLSYLTVRLASCQTPILFLTYGQNCAVSKVPLRAAHLRIAPN